MKSFLSPVWQTPFYSLTSEHPWVCKPSSRCGVSTSLGSCFMVSHPSRAVVVMWNKYVITSIITATRQRVTDTKEVRIEGNQKICCPSNLWTLACPERAREMWAKCPLWTSFPPCLSPTCFWYPRVQPAIELRRNASYPEESAAEKFHSKMKVHTVESQWTKYRWKSSKKTCTGQWQLALRVWEYYCSEWSAQAWMDQLLTHLSTWGFYYWIRSHFLYVQRKFSVEVVQHRYKIRKVPRRS